MANRTVYGNSFSSNGWPMVDTGSCTWVNVPGTSVTLQIQNGWPLAILRAFAADFNAYVEPLRDADSACWTSTNSVSTSNHLSGTAMDLNWDSHPFQVPDAGFDSAKIAAVRDILDFFEGTVFWGNDWSNPKDAMHLQLASLANGGDINTYNNPAVGDFIARKIRADGFSTFRRDNTSVPPPVTQPLSRADGYAVKIIAEGQRRGITPRGIEIALATGLVESNLTIYANAKVPASMDIPHDAVGSDGFSVGIFQQQVRDTGNGWWWGDAATCMDPTSSAGLFYDRLVTKDYNGPNSPGSYAQAVQSSAFPDRYDQRFNDAVAIYNRLVNYQGEDDLSADAERMIKEMYDEYQKGKKGPTRSFFAPDQNGVDSPLGFMYNLDGNVWNQEVTWGYLFGVQRAEELVSSVAQNGVVPTSWAGQLTDQQGNWLAEWGQQWCVGLISFRAAILRALKPTGAAPVAQGVAVDTSSLTAAQAQDIANRAAAAVASQVPAQVQAAVNNALPVPVPPPSVELATTEPDEADDIADLFRSLKAMKLADALPIESRAPLAALLSILNTKNGSTV